MMKMTACVWAVLMASGVVQAGGDVKVPHHKVECGKSISLPDTGVPAVVECGGCKDATCPPPVKCEPKVEVVPGPVRIEYVDVVPPPAKGKWLLAATGGYLGDPAVGGGAGYRFANGIEVLGQGMYLATEVERVSWAHTFGHGRCAQTYSGYKDVGQDGTWGGVVTVVFPLGGK